MTGQRGRERGRERGPTPRSRTGIAGTVYPRGKKWAYAVTLAPDPLTGERRRDARSGFDTEKAAWDALIEANNQLRSNTYVKNSTTTVGQFLDQWLATISISVKPTTHSNYRNYADYYVIPIIGDRKLQDITTDTITSLYTHLLHRGRRRGNSNQLMHEHWKRATGRQETPSARELATIGGVSYSAAVRALQRYRAGRVPTAYSPGLDPRTVHSVHIMLSRAFGDAVTQRLLSDNPVTDAARVRQTRKAHTVWDPEQLRRFLTQARTERLYPMWLMFATTGMRRSEAAGARRHHLDLPSRTITLWDTRVIAGGQAHGSDGKTSRSRRRLALDHRTIAALTTHLATLDQERATFGSGYTQHGLLFCWPDGRPLYPDTISEQFNRLVDRAGLPPITLHDVRHTYATMSLRAGVNPKIVSARLGHATVAFTLDTYTADVPELHHHAAETVSDLFLTDDPHEPGEPPIDLP
jgi:integrase